MTRSTRRTFARRLTTVVAGIAVTDVLLAGCGDDGSNPAAAGNASAPALASS